MEFYKKMYISPKIRDPRRIRQDLQRGKGHLTVYLLVLTEGPEGKAAAGDYALRKLPAALL